MFGIRLFKKKHIQQPVTITPEIQATVDRWLSYKTVTTPTSFSATGKCIESDIKEVVPVKGSVANGVPAWFCVPGIEQSVAEFKIATELAKYDCIWYSEVAFESFKSSKYGYYRFDFFIPAAKLIIEYDSKAFHNDPERLQIDGVKDGWCWKNGITVKRIGNKYYYKIPEVIAKIMTVHGICKKQ